MLINGSAVNQAAVNGDHGAPWSPLYIPTGFTSGGFGTPFRPATYCQVSNEVLYAPQPINALTATFASAAVTSDITTSTGWSVLSGAISGGVLGDPTATSFGGWREAQLTFATPITPTLPLTITANMVAKNRPGGSSHVFTVQLQQSTGNLDITVSNGSSGTNNLQFSTPWGYVEETAAVWTDGQALTMRAEFTATDLKFYLNNVLKIINFGGASPSGLTGVYVNGGYVDIDNLTFVATGSPVYTPNFDTPVANLGTPLLPYTALHTGPIAKVPAPYRVFTQTVQPAGFSATRIPEYFYATPGLPPYVVNGVYAQETFTPVVFGTPVALTPVSAPASGLDSTIFGTPNNARRIPAAGFSATHLGTPSLATGQGVTGWVATMLGTPISAYRQPAASTYRATRFGLPTYTLPNTRSTYGFCRTWFGHHRSVVGTMRTVSGIAAGHFGTPSTFARAKALHVPPACRFGKPLMTRALP